ncbi:cyclic nucleotide-gated ion channel 1-like isoform X2 [Tripterygium wilfordii]|nr:cyclic nucleotide-gated ion channel 1-like isoform X2 [Tripterygium wilfordii]
MGTSNVSYEIEEDGGDSEEERERERERKTFLYKWVKIFIVLLALAVSLLDPLFFYIPVVKNDSKKCISMDKKLETIVIVFRSLVDLFYAFFIVIRLHHDFFAPCYMMYKEGELVEHLWEIASKYLLRALPLDFLSAFPLPQVVLLIIVPTMRGSRFLKAIYLLRSVVLCQYVPRVLRTYSFATSGSFGEPAKARALFSPFLLMLAINGMGGLWYFLSIERLTQCWHEACENQVGCLNLFRCKDNNIGDLTFLNDFCPRDAHKTEFFDFGMFSDALESRIVETRDFPKKLLYCLHWGLLSLSCFGQNLQTSTHVWENVFAISIITLGLLLFLILLGNLQATLQARSARKEEMRRQAQEMEHWMPFKMVPEHLKSRVRRYLRYNWLESIGDDMDKFLVNLPEDLRKRIKSELHLKLIKMVPIFEKMDKPSLEALCDRLKAVIYTEESYVFREGEAVTEMLFIMQGRAIATNGDRDGFYNSAFLGGGDFCGEELLTWALEPHSTSRLPISTRNVRTITEVKAFTLKAEDLKFVATQFQWLSDKRLHHVFRFYSWQWRTWASCFIQAAWHAYRKRKHLEEEENRLQDPSTQACGKSLKDPSTQACGKSISLNTAIYASRFAANALRATRGWKAQMIQHTLLQKPPAPDFSYDEQ